MSSRTITIDPVTRIEGHQKIEATVEDGVVREAKMGLVFYLYGGELILYRDDANGVAMTKES